MGHWFGVPRAIWIYVAVAGTIGAIVFVQNVWDLNKSDWAAWAQAVGTVTAIGATIWLATSEARRRTSDARDIAVLTAAGMALRVSQSAGLIETYAQTMDAAHKHDCPPDVFGTLWETISALEICSDDEQIKVLPLPNGCAYNLAGARDLLGGAVVTLNRVSRSKERFDADSRKERAGSLARVLSAAHFKLESAAMECRSASMQITSLDR